ncbi:hypothetical protein, partial [Rheinheimera sp.]|uniref:hypothetical protein n=1 Tax=Rheinheimera sp. TaxID=1869214 RepID=UPI004047A889
MNALLQRNHLQGMLQDNENIKLSLITELTQNFNIHAHGTVRILLKAIKGKRSPQHFIQDYFRNMKDCGFIYIKPIDNYNVWKTYCQKNYRITKDE